MSGIDLGDEILLGMKKGTVSRWSALSGRVPMYHGVNQVLLRRMNAIIMVLDLSCPRS